MDWAVKLSGAPGVGKPALADGAFGRWDGGAEAPGPGTAMLFGFSPVRFSPSDFVLPLPTPIRRASPFLFLLFAARLGAVPQDVPNLKAAPVPSVAVPADRAERVARSFSTRFAADEMPLSAGGAWLGGKSAGLDWADVASASGLVYGLESGTGGYDDSTALLAGAWRPNQTAEATVHTVNQNDKISEEVELRLRSGLSPHSATGYEINFRCLKTKDAYTEIVRWDGPLGKFTYLSHKDGAQYGVKEGDVVRATVVGTLIRVYLNGVLVNQAADGTFPTGSPGIGFFLQGATGLNRDYGFTSFSASDQP